MATREVNSQNLESLINDSNMLFIDFWAQWCGPCRMFGPTFEAASEKNTDIVFAKCDTEAQQEVAAQFGIRSIPTLAVFKEGVMIFQQPGALPPAALDELIEKVKELDMDEVRKEMEKQSAAK
ncbi:MAG: thioredoxin [Deltaproteobacteria bacterium]|nr:thioredoxin [Deltaproteobacteria bacterium]